MIEEYMEEKIALEKKLEEESQSRQNLISDLADLNQKLFQAK